MSGYMAFELTHLHGENVTCLHLFEMPDSVLAEVKRNSSMNMNKIHVVLLLIETQRKAATSHV